MTVTDHSAKIAEFDHSIACMERGVEKMQLEMYELHGRINHTLDAIEILKRIREAEVKLAESEIKVALLEITLLCSEDQGVYE